MTSYTPCSSLMEKFALLGPCYVTGRNRISDAAFEEAGRTLEVMLQHRPDVVDSLRAHGAITAIFGSDQSVYDLPYFSDLKERPSAEGGLGGTVERPITGVSERNLLRLPNDPYFRFHQDGANVSVHELAHTIMNIGLTQKQIAAI